MLFIHIYSLVVNVLAPKVSVYIQTKTCKAKQNKDILCFLMIFKEIRLGKCSHSTMLCKFLGTGRCNYQNFLNINNDFLNKDATFSKLKSNEVFN